MARTVKIVPLAKEERKHFVRRYREAHPKLSPDAARARGNAIWNEYEESKIKSYRKVTAKLKEAGVSKSTAYRFSRRFKEINKEYYHRLKHPPMVRDIVSGKMRRMPKEQIKGEWLDDFRELYEKLKEEYDIDFRELYKEE